MSHPTDELDHKYANPLGFCASAIYETMDFCVQSAMHPDKRIRQADVLTHGLIVGGIKEIPNQILNHAGETATKMGVAGAIGAAFSLLIDSKTKFLSTGAKWLGLGMGVGAIAATAVDLHSKPKLKSALEAAWNKPEAVAAGKQIAEAECGPDGFNWGLSVPATIVGGIGAKGAMKYWSYRQALSNGAETLLKPDIVDGPTPGLDEAGRLLLEPTAHEFSMLQTFILHAQELVPGVKVDRAISIPEEAFGQPAVMAKIRLPAGTTRPFEDAYKLKRLAAHLAIDNDWLFDCTIDGEELIDMNGTAILLHGLKY
ncbi:MAG: hypothetical protein K2Y22_02290 [Candidatus Obscuribacterales bacterium]|nr:hypothetical protein [Candidatus Obscuribacterales bacterium]